MSIKGSSGFLLLALVLSGSLLAGCSSDDDSPGVPGPVGPGPDAMATCEGCHTDEAMLKATVEESVEAPESSGEG